MTKQEKAIREFCGHHADWWPSITQVQEMLALAHPKQVPVAWITPDGQRKPLTDEEIAEVYEKCEWASGYVYWKEFARAIEAAHNIKEKNNE